MRTHFLRSLISRCTADERETYVVACAAFLLIALAAVTIPAIRAARVEPVMALRDE